jgi:hypothetical protein
MVGVYLSSWTGDWLTTDLSFSSFWSLVCGVHFFFFFMCGDSHTCSSKAQQCHRKKNKNKIEARFQVISMMLVLYVLMFIVRCVLL